MLGESPRVSIEVPISPGEAQDVRGSRFESFVRTYLSKINFEVKSRLRFTGAEVDLLCKNSLSGDEIIVECKARKEFVQSADINKAFTNVTLRHCRQAWIFCISGIGSEAKGLIEEINCQNSNLIRTFDPNEIAKLVEECGLINRPNRNATSFTHFNDESLLLILENRLLWIETPTDPKTDERLGIIAYDEHGIPISQSANLPDLKETDFRLRDFEWLQSASALNIGSRLPHQSVVRVTPGESWSDFRPSRPRDFVGREHAISSITEFFNSVRHRNTRTRIFGVKGRSGWGKSSLILKIADHFKVTLPGLAYVFPVDCRAAQNFDFPDLAIRKALKEAYNDNFLMPLFRGEYEPVRNPFESEGYQAALRELESTRRLLVIVFDQFEEIIHRSDLVGAFNRFGEIAYAADELCSNVILGFSWKTDGTTSTDNAGYQIWHSLADHRRDFEIKPFTRDEAEEFLSQASASASVSISRDAKRFILEQYSGFPWLLKKLFVNYVETQQKSNTDNRSSPNELDIAALFAADLSELSEAEHSAILFIAENAPVEIYRVSDRYSVNITNSLLARRLIIQSGDAVSPYWDIFREYILTRRVPFIPVTYVPTLSGRKLVSAIRVISGETRYSYEALAQKMNVSIHTADNVVRDLTNMSLITPQRQSGIFEIFDLSGEEITRRIIDFVRRHVIYHHIEAVVAKKPGFQMDDIFDAVAISYSFISPNRKTLESYIKKIVNLSANVGLIRRESHLFILGTPIQNIMKANISRKALIGTELFRAHAPPSQVERLLQTLDSGPMKLENVKALGLRNASFSANALGLAQTENEIVKLGEMADPSKDWAHAIVRAALGQETINYAIERLRESPQLPGREIGEAVSDMFQLDWSPSSCNRYGTALRAWAKWIIDRS